MLTTGECDVCCVWSFFFLKSIAWNAIYLKTILDVPGFVSSCNRPGWYTWTSLVCLEQNINSTNMEFKYSSSMDCWPCFPLVDESCLIKYLHQGENQSVNRVTAILSICFANELYLYTLPYWANTCIYFCTLFS